MNDCTTVTRKKARKKKDGVPLCHVLSRVRMMRLPLLALERAGAADQIADGLSSGYCALSAENRCFSIRTFKTTRPYIHGDIQSWSPVVAMPASNKDRLQCCRYFFCAGFYATISKFIADGQWSSSAAKEWEIGDGDAKALFWVS